jgi:hypothetical protein
MSASPYSVLYDQAMCCPNPAVYCRTPKYHAWSSSVPHDPTVYYTTPQRTAWPVDRLTCVPKDPCTAWPINRITWLHIAPPHSLLHDPAVYRMSHVPHDSCTAWPNCVSHEPTVSCIIQQCTAWPGCDILGSSKDEPAILYLCTEVISCIVIIQMPDASKYSSKVRRNGRNNQKFCPI